MALLPSHITRAIEELSKLPGIGTESAERLVFHLLHSRRASPETLGHALVALRKELRYCRNCQMVTTEDDCVLCRSAQRDAMLIMVVETPLDVVAFEKTHYKGLYHVLHGVLSPIDGFGPAQLKLRELIDRCTQTPIRELIIATNPDIEGEATASYLEQTLRLIVPTITRLAHGLPMGADIEFADQTTLAQVIIGRRTLRQTDTTSEPTDTQKLPY